MSEMIERVAKAIKTEGNRWIFWVNLPTGQYEAWRWELDLSEKTHVIPLGSDKGGVIAAEKFNKIKLEWEARAAISAMREPTETMEAGARDMLDHNCWPDGIYRATIDKALI